VTAGAKLHQFDLRLGAYLCHNFSAQLRRQAVHRQLQVELAPQLFEWLLDRDPEPPPELDGPPLKAFIDEHARSHYELLLGRDELLALETCAVSALSRTTWIPNPVLHQGRVDTEPEVREQLTRQTAEEWAVASSQFARQLEEDRLSFLDGVQLVVAWIDALRRLLRAMGAGQFLPPPEGTFPTPTQPKPAGSVQLAGQLAQDMADMRRAIAEHPQGQQAKAKALIGLAHINPQRGRNALRELEKLGEYQGFARPLPRRYRKQEPEQH